MKKVLCILLALTSIFCLAACEDGRCDECRSDKNVEIYEIDGKDKELCPQCALEAGWDGLGDAIFGGK